MTELLERPDCPYCRGVRANCTCEEDCLARSPHWCPKAEGYIESLRSTGLYTEGQLASLADQGYK